MFTCVLCNTYFYSISDHTVVHIVTELPVLWQPLVVVLEEGCVLLYEEAVGSLLSMHQSHSSAV